MSAESEPLSINEANLKKLQDCLAKHHSLCIQDIITAFGATDPTSAMQVLWALCGESFTDAPEVVYGDERPPVLYQPSLYDWANLAITAYAFPAFLILKAPVSIDKLRQMRLFSFEEIFTFPILSNLMLWLFDWSSRATPKIGCVDERKMYPAWLLLYRCRSEQPSLIKRFRALYHSRDRGRALQTKLYTYIEETSDRACLKFLVDAGFWTRGELMQFVDGIYRVDDHTLLGSLVVDLVRHGYIEAWQPGLRNLPAFRGRLRMFVEHPESAALFGVEKQEHFCVEHGEMCSLGTVREKRCCILKHLEQRRVDGRVVRRRWSFKSILETLVALSHLGLPVLVVENTVRYVHPLRTENFTLFQLYQFAGSVANALRRRQR